MSSFLGVVLVLFVFGLVFALFALSEDIRLFAFHLFSYNPRIVTTTRRFDDRQSLVKQGGLHKIRNS